MPNEMKNILKKDIIDSYLKHLDDIWYRIRNISNSQINIDVEEFNIFKKAVEVNTSNMVSCIWADRDKWYMLDDVSSNNINGYWMHYLMSSMKYVYDHDRTTRRYIADRIIEDINKRISKLNITPNANSPTRLDDSRNCTEWKRLISIIEGYIKIF